LNKDKGKVKSPFYLFYSILIGAVEFEEKERRRRSTWIMSTIELRKKKVMDIPDSAKVVCWGRRRCIPCALLDVGREPRSSAPVHGGLRKTPGWS